MIWNKKKEICLNTEEVGLKGASHMGQNRNHLFSFVKSEISTTFITGSFLHKLFISTEWPWRSTGVKLYGWVKSYLLFKKRKKKSLGMRPRCWRLSYSPKKIYLITSIWVITQAANDMKILSQDDFLLPARLSQKQPAHCPVIRTHLQLELYVCNTAGMRYRGLLHDQINKEFILFSLASSINTSDDNLEMLSPWRERNVPWGGYVWTN